MQSIDISPLSGGLHARALQDLPAASIVTDAEQRIVLANSAFESISGYPLSELLGRNCRILQGDETAPATVAAIRLALHEGRSFQGRIRNYRKDGTAFWNLLTVTPLRDGQGTVTHFVGVLLDVTDTVAALEKPEHPEPSEHVREAAEIDPPAGPAARPVPRGHLLKDGRPWHGIDGSDPDPLELKADLHDALERGEVVACFQPQYDARTGALTGYEALARWHHPDHGVLPPDRFIPLAEADGLISRLGEEILEQACRFADLAAAGRPIQMQVNVSAQQLTVAGLADRIQRILAVYPDRTWSLGVEITESVLILDHALVRAELEHIRELGVGVSIDDFGSGYSSLSQLRDLPATELKIDRSFVHREDAVGTSLLTAILALATSLDLTVVAEGIETGSQLATLRALGCDRLQGMYLCPPLDAGQALTAPSDIVALLPAAAAPRRGPGGSPPIRRSPQV